MTPEELARLDALEEAKEEAEATEPAVVPAFSPYASASPGAGRTSGQALGGPAVERLQQVSLGAGIALVGLGLGFLGLRMRRSA